MCITGPKNRKILLVFPQTQTPRLIRLQYQTCTIPNTSHTRHANLLNICSQSPSIYVVFPSIRGHDGCEPIGPTFVDLTTSFAPGALSTVRPDNTTHSFNFGDLPCPPADIEWDFSKGPYAPTIAPPEFLFNLDPAFKTCIHGATQGIDPPMTLTHGAADFGPGAVGCRRGNCNRAKRAMEHTHPIPWAPQRTAEPTS